MNYSFNLDWDELDDELKEQKIDEYTEYCAREGDGHISPDDAEQEIKAHFPIYF